MNIRLGNLKVSEIENRLGIQFPKDIVDLMNDSHQGVVNGVNIEKGKWHCFDIPFELVCGDIELATKIYNSVKDKSSQCKEKLQISVQR